MNTNPILSIVIPTFNQGSYIEACLLSIVEQSLKDIEIIIQDSLSSDDTETICLRYSQKDPRIKYFREKDKGQTDALNRGLEKSTGLYWTWICSDDFYTNLNALEKLCTSLDNERKKSQLAVGAFGNSKYYDENAKVLGAFNDSFKKNLEEADLIHDWPISQPSSILLRSRIIEIGFLNSSLYLGMDLDLFLKMLNEKRYFIYVDTYVSGVRVQSNSKSVVYRKKTAENALTLIRNHFGHVGKLRRSQYVMELININLEKIIPPKKNRKLHPCQRYRLSILMKKNRSFLEKIFLILAPQKVTFFFDTLHNLCILLIPYYIFRVLLLFKSWLKWNLNTNKLKTHHRT